MKKNLSSNLKGLLEKRNEKIVALENMTDKTMKEERAFTADEKAEFERLENEVRDLTETIDACKKEWDSEIREMPEDKRAEAETEKAEIRAFESYIRGKVIDEETRADSNWTVGDNGAVIPKRIANKILEEVRDICNIYDYATKFNIGGTLSFPEYDESNGGIEMAYAEEFSKLTATSGKFESVDLKGFLAAALTKVSRSLINNDKFALFPYVVHKMAEAIARWLEKELLVGTETKIEGLSKAEIMATGLTADDLIDLQDSINQSLQKNCRFIMSSKTKNKIRKFKDGQGNYLLERDYTTGNGQWTLLGKPVELTDAMADDDILYGDFSGLYVKITENPNMQILNEVFATEHAVGIVAWLEMDAKLIEKQKVKRLKVGE